MAIAIGRWIVKGGRELGFGGSKLRTFHRGYVADECPTCGTMRPQEVFSYEEKSGMLSSWTECARINRCTLCCELIQHDPNRYSAIVVNDDWSGVDELDEITRAPVRGSAADPGGEGSDEPHLCHFFARNLLAALDDGRHIRRSGGGGGWGLVGFLAILALAGIGFGGAPWVAGGVLAALVGFFWLIWSFGTWRDVHRAVLPHIEHFVNETNHDLRDVKEALENISGGWRVTWYVDWETGSSTPRPNLVWMAPTSVLLVGLTIALLMAL